MKNQPQVQIIPTTLPEQPLGKSIYIVYIINFKVLISPNSPHVFLAEFFLAIKQPY